MSKSNVNISRLREQSQELYSLIRDTNGVLNDADPISELRVNYEQRVSNLAPKVMDVAKAAVATRRRPREILMATAVAAAAVAVGWTGAACIDAARNGIAKANAKKALMGYYEQLAAKQNMIIEEQQRINWEMAQVIDNLEENEEENREKIRVLQSRQRELSELLYRFSNLKKQVEK